MGIGTKILVLMLLMTIGSSGLVAWIVTLSVTHYETDRQDHQISLAIGRYVRQLDEHCQEISHLVQVLMGDPTMRSLLEAADDPGNESARQQLKQEVFGRDMQRELASPRGTPSFHVLIDLAGEVVMVSTPTEPDGQLEHLLSSTAIHWPVDSVINSDARAAIQYVATPQGLFVAMGIPLREELDQPPTHAYFVGFHVDDAWVSHQLLAEQDPTESMADRLLAWFVVDGAVVARASSDPSVSPPAAFDSRTILRQATAAASTAAPTEFNLAGERFVGQSFDLDTLNAESGRLILAGSLDRALVPLHRLQRSILLTTFIACAVAFFACRGVARVISRPIQELVQGTVRIAAGQFDSPVQIRRRDELGALADSFNHMAQGLKQRDGLLEERVKMERDLALARKIQMDVLPRQLPVCPGYDLAAFSLPAEQTGGDIYDLMVMAIDPTGSDRPATMMLLLADATGHGIGPAISVTQVRSMLRIGVRLQAQMDNILSQINRQLCQDLGSGRFVTAFLGMLDPFYHRISYQSAGQGPLLHFHARTHRIEWLDSSMMPLGVDEHAKDDRPQPMDLESGDLIVLLTDGFYEYQNRAGELFGRERIAEMILQHHHLSARQILDHLLEETRRFANGAPQLDDMTGLLIRRLETPA
jgi:serine phosphatase RsbU (regulator of sigma subunit)